MADAEENGTREKEEKEDLERRLSLRETTDAPTILLPCAICARTFKPQSLEKHRRICERSALKKRKPFDSAKQRIQGTELAEFAPKRETRRPSQDGSQERTQDRSPKSKSGWKQTHDQLLQALREARRENVDVPPRRQKTAAPASMTTTTTTTTSALPVPSGAPTRANEKGTCPTCNRQFGIKAYDRHVAWCKERATRLPLSPATNVAKERLEARMKYRAPILKNRRALNREKYSPGSVGNFNSLGCKTSPTSPTSTVSTTSATAARESLSVPACNKIQETVLNPKQTVTSTTGRRLSRGGMPVAAPLTSVLPCSGSVTGSSKYSSADRNNRGCRGKSRKVREAISLASKYICKPEKSKASEEGIVRLNDVTVNEGVIGMTVRPCNVYRISYFDNDAGLTCKRTQNVTESRVPHGDCGTTADDRCDDENSPGQSPRRTSSRISVAESTERNTTLAEDEGLDLTYSIIHSLDGDRPKDEDPDEEMGDAIEETRTLETSREEQLPVVQESATRCATYVIEEASGERKVTRRKMKTLRKNRDELEEETVRIISSEEPVHLRIREQYVNGDFECQSEEESLGEIEEVPKKGSSERRIANHLSKDFDSRTASARITEKKIRERMKALRGSTDSLISSIERTDRTERTSCAASVEPADRAQRHSEPLPAIVTNYVRRRYDSRNLVKSNENSSYWEKVSQVVENRREVKWTEPLNKERLLIRNRKIQNLPPVILSPKASQPNFHSDIGTSAEPVGTDLRSDDPFYLAERQMNELSSTDASDRSIDPTITDHSPSNLNSNFPLSRSPSAFVKYVGHFDLNRNSNPNRSSEKRSSVIAPPSQFDDLTSSEFSSDSTETNSISREIFAEAFRESAASRQHRVVMDKSRPSANLDANSNSGRDKTFVNSRKILEKPSGKITRPTVNRSQSVRSASAPRPPPVSQERNRSLGSGKKGNPRASSPAAIKAATDQTSKSKKKIFVSANKNNLPMSSSNLSLSSIVSSELDVKGPNYMREEFTSSFEDDAASSSFPLLRSFLKTDSAFALSSPIDRTDRTNTQRNSEDDEENLSSPDSYKRHDRDPTKHTVDSAYSSLNRKYSNHGHSGDDVVTLGSRRFYEEDVVETPPRCKMSKFCHECGSRFPETAKFCCECGVRRLAF